ncbi:MAG: protein phosphatase CheZ [Rhodocyclales bacterium]|nr:protein phosphatase CheZ [Rhodocyclales bacterium]
MTKKLKQDEAGDSDDLQALFDSIATGTEQPAAKVKVVAKAAANVPDDGDNDDLQNLFDQVAAEFGEQAPDAANDAPTVAASGDESARSVGGEAVFNRIGHMTRQVHDTLRGLGGDDSALLSDAVQAIPDARQRLSYIAQMTEQAASRVLNATDIAKPLADKAVEDATELQQRWDRLYANQLSVDEFKTLAGETRHFLGEVTRGSQVTSEQLMEIMMAQDFQDLTGQVIKKVVDLAQKLETELLQILLEVTPAEKRVKQADGLMNGPVINSDNREDVVTSQEQVDDLLDSLGF